MARVENTSLWIRQQTSTLTRRMFAHLGRCARRLPQFGVPTNLASGMKACVTPSTRARHHYRTDVQTDRVLLPLKTAKRIQAVLSLIQHYALMEECVQRACLTVPRSLRHVLHIWYSALMDLAEIRHLSVPALDSMSTVALAPMWICSQPQQIIQILRVQKITCVPMALVRLRLHSAVSCKHVLTAHLCDAQMARVAKKMKLAQLWQVAMKVYSDAKMACVAETSAFHSAGVLSMPRSAVMRLCVFSEKNHVLSRRLEILVLLKDRRYHCSRHRRQLLESTSALKMVEFRWHHFVREVATEDPWPRTRNIRYLYLSRSKFLYPSMKAEFF